VSSLAATVIGAPQFWDIPVPDKPAGLYELPSQNDFISIPVPQKPSGLYELPSSSNQNDRIVLGDPIRPVPSNDVTNAIPPPRTPAEDEPLMPYEMSYNIMDGINSIYHTREEVQTDKDLTGSYSYLRPDGIYQTVEYYVDNMGYHAKVIESEIAPPNMQAVESNRAKYEVKLPNVDSYLIDVDDAELQQYIQDALSFEPAVIPQESQVSPVAQASNQLSTTSQEIQTSIVQQQPPQVPFPGLQPPSKQTGYNYPEPQNPFNFPG